MEDARVRRIERVALVAAEVTMEGAHCRRMAGRVVAVERIAEQPQRQHRIEAGRRIHQFALRPQAEAGLGQSLPGEMRAGIALARRRHVGVRDHLGARDV